MVEQRKAYGFTLIELLVVIAIIAILAAILFPVFVKAKESGRTARCASNLKQINTALLVYVDDYNGRFPDSRGMYYCRLLDITHGWHAPNQAIGPYAIDLLATYIKNKSIWLCPTLSPTQVVPDFHGWVVHSTEAKPFFWRDNCGGNVRNRSTASNLLWIHERNSRANPYDKYIRVSGSSASEIRRATRAMMFFEMPYWVADTPHKLSGRGINVVFYDGHVKTEYNPTDGLSKRWEGWEY